MEHLKSICKKMKEEMQEFLIMRRKFEIIEDNFFSFSAKINLWKNGK